MRSEQLLKIYKLNANYSNSQNNNNFLRKRKIIKINKFASTNNRNEFHVL